jgi:beta-fructofuranosidase
VSLELPDRRIGDAWFFHDGRRWHGYVLTSPLDVERHARWDVSHAVSEDLRRWTYEGVCIAAPPDDAWDAGCLATGSVIRRPSGSPADGRYLMAHSVRHAGPEPAVKIVTGDDLHAWRPTGDGPALTLRDFSDNYEPIGSGSRRFPHFRDPFLFMDQGVLHVAVTASRNTGPPDGRGSVAIARWGHTGWQPMPPPELPPVAQELECPQLVRTDDHWLLVFSSQASWIRGRGSRPAGMYTFVGDSPSGPFRGPYVVPHEDGLYAGQLLRASGRWQMLATAVQGLGSLADPVDVNDFVTGLH